MIADSGASRSRHRVLENRLPFWECEVRRDQHAAASVALRQNREQHLHFLPGLLDITRIVDDEGFVVREFFDGPVEPKLLPGRVPEADASSRLARGEDARGPYPGQG
jgi:hypothetical protein